MGRGRRRRTPGALPSHQSSTLAPDVEINYNSLRDRLAPASTVDTDMTTLAPELRAGSSTNRRPYRRRRLITRATYNLTLRFRTELRAHSA